MPNDDECPNDSAPDEKSEHDYKVGRGRPPKEYSYKKGQSGNPAGAPKRIALNLGAALEQAFQQNVSSRINGKERNVSAIEALYVTDMQGALAGNLGALRRVLKLAKKSHRFADLASVRGVIIVEDPESELAKIRKEYFDAKAAGEDPFAKYGLDGP